jgi:hydrogenase maturation protease
MNASTASHPPRIAVVGLGNVLLGDDGFGPLAVEMFRRLYECDSNVEILDLGTPGLDLAPYLYDTDLVVIADAVYPPEDEKPGTLCVYCENDLAFSEAGSSHAQPRLTSHDPGVQESLAQLRLAGHAPSEVIVVGVVPESCGLGKGISLSVLNTCLVAVDTIARLLVARSIDCRKRHDPVPRTLWWQSGSA